MKRKLQVFISSTYEDLKKEREEVVHGVLAAHHIPAGMELFSAGQKQLETIYQWIDESDIYVLLLGGRYGSIDPETGKSYTHLEYEYAVSKGKPMFAVILTDEYLDRKIRNGIQSNKIYERENVSKYSDFKMIVKDRLARFADDTKEIRGVITTQILHMANDKKYSFKGWIRGDIYEKLLNENTVLLDRVDLQRGNSTIAEREIKHSMKSGLLEHYGADEQESIDKKEFEELYQMILFNALELLDPRISLPDSLTRFEVSKTIFTDDGFIGLSASLDFYGLFKIKFFKYNSVVENSLSVGVVFFRSEALEYNQLDRELCDLIRESVVKFADDHDYDVVTPIGSIVAKVDSNDILEISAALANIINTFVPFLNDHKFERLR